MAATANAREVIAEATLGELEGTLRGRLVRPSDPDYNQARSVWNAAHDRRPALIIRCAGTADVVRAVQFARSEGLQLAVRGGSHSVAGFSTSDGGVVIDISSMKGIRVDPVARRAVAQAGLTWAEFDHETQAFGLAVTGGFPEHVEWARATHQAVDPWTTGGAYVNFASESGADKVQASYPPDTYARLVAVKDRYDPANLFQLNQNIRPSGRSWSTPTTVRRGSPAQRCPTCTWPA